MKNIKLIIAFALIITIVNCDIFNNPVDPMSKDYVGYPVTVEFSVGDLGQAGGYIFYVKDSYSEGWRYLESAPEDISRAKIWGTKSFTVLGADGIAIGTGAQNTIDIIAGDSSNNTAALACAEYYIEYNDITFDDWFLPSKDELDAMYENLKVTDLGGLEGSTYWSSSESSSQAAWHHYFNEGRQAQAFKNNYRYVRPIRAF